MFSILMRYQPFQEQGDSIEVGRVFEYTEETLREQFSDGENPDLDQLIRLPCVFMEEGREDQVARVGYINEATQVGGMIRFSFRCDPDIAPIRNSEIYARQNEFHMPHDFEFSRSHWAVKNVDLFRLLLRGANPVRQRPRVFDLADYEEIQAQLVSVMMPFGAEFNPIYDAITNAIDGAGLRGRRADEIWENPAIIQDIVSLIDRSRIVVCDCTGRNPNVFYEIGIAHTLGREVVLITQNDADIPFDLRHLRYIRYLPNAEGLGELTARLRERFQHLLEAG